MLILFVVLFRCMFVRNGFVLILKWMVGRLMFLSVVWECGVMKVW